MLLASQKRDRFAVGPGQVATLIVINLQLYLLPSPVLLYTFHPRLFVVQERMTFYGCTANILSFISGLKLIETNYISLPHYLILYQKRPFESSFLQTCVFLLHSKKLHLKWGGEICAHVYIHMTVFTCTDTLET